MSQPPKAPMVAPSARCASCSGECRSSADGVSVDMPEDRDVPSGAAAAATVHEQTRQLRRYEDDHPFADHRRPVQDHHRRPRGRRPTRDPTVRSPRIAAFADGGRRRGPDRGASGKAGELTLVPGDGSVAATGGRRRRPRGRRRSSPLRSRPQGAPGSRPGRWPADRRSSRRCRRSICRPPPRVTCSAPTSSTRYKTPVEDTGRVRRADGPVATTRPPRPTLPSRGRHRRRQCCWPAT